MCLTANNLKVRNWVFSIPKRLRIYFLYNRKLLAKLSVCAWSVPLANVRNGFFSAGETIHEMTPLAVRSDQGAFAL